MSARHLAMLFLVFAAQLAVPLAMIRAAERTISEGGVFRFRTAPVDPVDLFHGRYVALQFVATSGPAVEGETFEWGMRAYAQLEEDPEGFARIRRISQEAPEDPDYLCVRVQQMVDAVVHFDFPLDRFYLEESIAPVAEEAYRERRGEDTWARIRVRKGHALIEDVLIDSISLREVDASRHPTPSTTPRD